MFSTQIILLDRAADPKYEVLQWKQGYLIANCNFVPQNLVLGNIWPDIFKLLLQRCYLCQKMLIMCILNAKKAILRPIFLVADIPDQNSLCTLTQFFTVRGDFSDAWFSTLINLDSDFKKHLAANTTLFTNNTKGFEKSCNAYLSQNWAIFSL